MRTWSGKPRRAAVRWLTGLACAAVLSSPALARPRPAPQQGAFPIEPAQLERLWSLLYEPVRRGLPPDEPRLVERVARLGPDAIPAVVAVLRGEVEPPSGSPSPTGLAELHERVLRASLGSFSAGDVLAHLATRLDWEQDLELRLFVAEVLADLADPRALAMLLSLSADVEPLQLASPVARERLGRALTRQLNRDERGFVSLERFALGCAPPLLPTLALGVAGTQRSRGAELLTRWLGRGERLDADVLRVLDEMLLPGTLVLPQIGLRLVRERLDSPLPATRRAAATVLARLYDNDSFDRFVRMLADEDPRLRDTARWCLTRLGGRDVGSDPADWIAWAEAEARWWSRRAPTLLARLEGEDQAAAYEAIVELLPHPLYRHEIADALGPLLLHWDASLARAACGVLVQHASRESLRWLVDGLAASKQEVSREALSALHELTGWRLGPDWGVWQVAVNR